MCGEVVGCGCVGRVCVGGPDGGGWGGGRK